MASKQTTASAMPLSNPDAARSPSLEACVAVRHELSAEVGSDLHSDRRPIDADEVRAKSTAQPQSRFAAAAAQVDKGLARSEP